MSEIKIPIPKVVPTVGGILYPNAGLLTDTLAAQAFSEDHVTGSEYKYGTLAGGLGDVDLRWLAERGEETSPALRTVAYLAAVQEEIDIQLESGQERVYFDRHCLPEIFGTLAVGTPYSYTDIGVSRHPKGVLLTSLGGGYAGNGPLVQLANQPNSEGVALYKGLSARYSFEDDGKSVQIPVANICGRVLTGLGELGMDAEAVAEELKALYSYQPDMIRRPHNEGVTRWSAPHTKYGVTYTYRGTGASVEARIGRRFVASELVDRDRDIGIRSIPGLGSVEVLDYTTHPEHRITSEGVVSYGIRDDVSPFEGHFIVEISTGGKPDLMDVSHDILIKRAAMILEGIDPEEE